MAYYYVKNGGTATGDAGRYATQQTGSFATLGTANYYNDIITALAATTPPASGDFVNPSDLHNYTILSTPNYAGIPSNPFFVVAVDDANIDQARTSGNRFFEGSASSAVDVLINNMFISGGDIQAGDDMVVSGNNQVYDSSLQSAGPGDVIRVNADGTSIDMMNSELSLQSGMQLSNASELNFVNVTPSMSVAGLINGTFGNGGGKVTWVSSDLTNVTGFIFQGAGASQPVDDLIDVRFDLCKIATGVAFTSETFKSYNQRALFTRCSDSSAAAEYQYALCCFGGGTDASGGPGVEDDSAIFRNEDEAFTESNQKISYKIITNSDASLGSPLWLDFPVLRYSELSAGATDTLRFYLTSDTALTDKDIYIEVSYPDGTNKQTPNFISSAPTTVGGTLDLMATGTTLTTDSTSTWTGGLTNKYQIDLNTSVDVGADCLPIVKVYITKPSITIQIASEFGLS